MWAVLTRLEEPKKHNLTLLQKLKLYDGKTLPGFTAGQHQGAAQGGQRARAWTASRPRYVQDKISNALVSDQGEGCINPFMVHERARDGPAPPLADHQRGAAQALRASCSALVKQEYEDIVKNEVQRAISADEDAIAQAVRQLHRQHQGLHPEGEGQEQVHRPGRGAGRAADAVDRGEDRHPREPQGRLPPRDHELHRRAGDRGQALRLPHQRAAAEGARAEAVRGPEGLDQADEPGRRRSSTRRRRRRSTWSRTA